MTWIAILVLVMSGDSLFIQKKDGPDVVSISGATSVQRDGAKAILVVTSPRGIGRETLQSPNNKWPREVTLRFQYGEGRGFSRLESLELRTDRLLATWQPHHEEGGIRLMGEQAMDFVFADEQGLFPKGVPKAGSLSINVEVTPNGLDVQLPANLLNGSRELKIEWVDMFR